MTTVHVARAGHKVLPVRRGSCSPSAPGSRHASSRPSGPDSPTEEGQGLNPYGSTMLRFGHVFSQGWSWHPLSPLRSRAVPPPVAADTVLALRRPASHNPIPATPTFAATGTGTTDCPMHSCHWLCLPRACERLSHGVVRRGAFLPPGDETPFRIGEPLFWKIS